VDHFLQGASVAVVMGVNSEPAERATLLTRESGCVAFGLYSTMSVSFSMLREYTALGSATNLLDVMFLAVCELIELIEGLSHGWPERLDYVYEVYEGAGVVLLSVSGLLESKLRNTHKG